MTLALLLAVEVAATLCVLGTAVAFAASAPIDKPPELVATSSWR